MTSITLETLPQYLTTAWDTVQRRIGEKRLVAAINIVALALLTSSLADWTWRFAQPKLPQVYGVAEHAAPERERLNLQALLEAHLFGQAQQIADPQTPSPDEVPLSSLNLVLSGVVVAGENSIALISGGGQPETPYAIGEEITHGAILHAVYPDRVILMRAGVLESLVLDDESGSLIGSTVSGPGVNRPTRAPSPAEIRQLGENRFSLPRDLIGQQLGNPDFLRQAHIIPSKDGGFLVRKITPGSMYEKLGLQRGDVIKSINGQPLNSVQDVMSHYGNLGQLNQAQVEVLRNGQTEVLQFNLE